MNRKPLESRIDRGERFIWKDGEIEITPAPGKAMPGLASSGLPWPEFVYRLIEHYKWEPQHLRGTVAEFDTRMRRQEVPLNFLFNILLRWLSSDAIKGLLNRFCPANDVSGPLGVERLWEAKFAQPDVRIESPCSRILIEVKVDAVTKLEQLQRFLLLHAEMNARFGEKRPYLFFLTKNGLSKCWQPRGELKSDVNVQDSLRRLSEVALPESLGRRALKEASASYEDVRTRITYGAATWSAIGMFLRELGINVGDSINRRAIEDFVSELHKRGLFEDRILASGRSTE